MTHSITNRGPTLARRYSDGNTLFLNASPWDVSLSDTLQDGRDLGESLHMSVLKSQLRMLMNRT